MSLKMKDFALDCTLTVMRGASHTPGDERPRCRVSRQERVHSLIPDLCPDGPSQVGKPLMDGF